MDVWLSFRADAQAAGITDRIMFTGGTLTVILVAFYLHGWFFVLADWYGFLDRYAIRSGKHRLVAIERQWEAIREATIDVFAVKPVLLYFIFPYVAGIFIHFDKELPSLSTAACNWLCMKCIFATSLYWLHRGMHHKAIYQYVHKRHHSYYDTVGFTAQYAHPVESLVSSLHVIFAIILVRPHFLVYCAFMATTMMEIVDAHCGYDVPWSILYPWSDWYFWGSGARVHDYHHSHNLGTYGGGITGLWDRLLGTDADFVKYEEKRKSDLASKKQ